MMFKTTRWTVISRARDGSGETAGAALEQLCTDYWSPLYAYVRSKGYSPEEAADAVQEFFYRIVKKNLLEGLDPARGRFRNFLRTALTNFLINEYVKSQSSRRSSGVPLVSIDFALAEKRFSAEPADHLTPDKVFDREWALVLMRDSIASLEREYESHGRGERFQILKPFITVESQRLPYDDVAARLGVTSGAVKVAIHRLRQHYRESLRDEVRQTLDDSATDIEVEEEIRYLMSALSV